MPAAVLLGAGPAGEDRLKVFPEKPAPVPDVVHRERRAAAPDVHRVDRGVAHVGPELHVARDVPSPEAEDLPRPVDPGDQGESLVILVAQVAALVVPLDRPVPVPAVDGEDGIDVPVVADERVALVGQAETSMDLGAEVKGDGSNALISND